MKTIMKKLTLSMMLLLTILQASAYDFEVNGIYYNITDATSKEVAVTYKDGNMDVSDYSGNIIIPPSVSSQDEQYTVTSIGESAFYKCSSLTSIEFPTSLTSIGESAFYKCSSLPSIELPTSLTSIGSDAFAFCSSLTSIELPASLTSIGDNAFASCSFTSIELPASLTSIGNSAFRSCSYLTSIELPTSLTTIRRETFEFCSSLTSIELPTSLTSIGNNAFAYCSSLTSIEFPTSLTSIGNNAFWRCSSLSSIKLSSNSLDISSNAFDELNSVIIGPEVKSVGEYSSLKTVKAIWLGNTPPTNASKISADINYVSNNTFSLKNQKVYSFLSSYFEVDNTIYVPVSPSERTCDVIDCNYQPSSPGITIGAVVNNRGINLNVLNINAYSFYGNKNIKNLSIGNQGEIGSYAFFGCDGLETAVINNIGSIMDYAFRGCEMSKSLTIGKEVTTIGKYAFYDNSGLSEVIIPDNITAVGTYAFSNCTSLKKVSIGKGIEKLQIHTFDGCSSLDNITIPSNISEIGDYVFSRCSSLGDVAIEENPAETEPTTIILGSNGSSPLFADCPLDEVFIGRKLSYKTSSSYGYSPFYRNTSLRSVKITDKETEIYPNEFCGCSNMQSFECGDGVTKIGNWAFSGCSAMTSYSSGSKVETIGDEAFSDCTALKTFTTLALEPPVCGTQALDDINKWDCILHVPAEALDKYKAAPQWKEFFFVEEASGIDDIITDGNVEIRYTSGGVTIDNLGETAVEVYTVDGRLYGKYPAYRGEEIKLGKGIFIVRAANKIWKIAK